MITITIDQILAFIVGLLLGLAIIALLKYIWRD